MQMNKLDWQCTISARDCPNKIEDINMLVSLIRQNAAVEAKISLEFEQKILKIGLHHPHSTMIDYIRLRNLGLDEPEAHLYRYLTQAVSPSRTFPARQSDPAVPPVIWKASDDKSSANVRLLVA